MLSTDTEENSAEKMDDPLPPPKDWADSPKSDENVQNIDSSKEEKRKTENKLGIRTYCPRCRVDSHSEKECTAALFKQATKRKITDSGDSKPGKSKSNTKRRKTFNKFKQDLEQVVLKGRCIA